MISIDILVLIHFKRIRIIWSHRDLHILNVCVFLPSAINLGTAFENNKYTMFNFNLRC